jgi:hypothetical protein
MQIVPQLAKKRSPNADRKEFFAYAEAFAFFAAIELMSLEGGCRGPRCAAALAGWGDVGGVDGSGTAAPRGKVAPQQSCTQALT